MKESVNQIMKVAAFDWVLFTKITENTDDTDDSPGEIADFPLSIISMRDKTDSSFSVE